MASLNYSANALGVLHRFYRKSFVAYVEYEEDVAFWYVVLTTFGAMDPQLKIANGKQSILVIADQIVNQNAKVVAALDMDYDDITKRQIFHPLVLYTYGYSIENTLYNESGISATVSQLSFAPNSNVQISTLIAEFENRVINLLELDLANEQTGRGVSVMGQSCARFLTSTKSERLCVNRIANHHAGLVAQFTTEEIENARTSLARSSKGIWMHTRGHFLTAAISNLIKKEVKKRRVQKKDIHLSNDILVSTLTSHLKIATLPEAEAKWYADSVNAMMGVLP